ncbi:MotA/TolQ/ExbB proton channel family protein [Rhodospirillaceae bacterium SYSU D60014]|uniref:motility protein A n=1 Tax=Virgifigura deserti TaxID=2268457 RepID=UPI000E66240D
MVNLTSNRARRYRPPTAPVAAGPEPRGFDVATLLGLAGAACLVALAIGLGGTPGAFVDLPAILIVLGGTAAVTLMSFSLEDVARAQPMMIRALVTRIQDPATAAREMLLLAETARQNTPLALQAALPKLRHDPFQHRAVSLVVDGAPVEEIERVMTYEMQATMARQAKSAGVLHRAAEIAPAMGLIGTLVGLVQMLGGLDDPATIGPSMSVALLTTLYGALLANMVFAPLASKLERIAEVEALINQIYVLGALSIGRQENPRRLQMLLNTVLPPENRIRHFD